MPYLKEDTYALLDTSRLYGKAGEPVSIISDRGGVLIVQLKDGHRIPLLPKDLTDDTSTDQPAVEVPALETKAPAAIRRQKRAKPGAGASPAELPSQSSLF